jgi:hypothetical protein
MGRDRGKRVIHEIVNHVIGLKGVSIATEGLP